MRRGPKTPQKASKLRSSRPTLRRKQKANRPAPQAEQLKTRPLRAGDLADVIALDNAILGRSRRVFFEKRLEAALKHPDSHIQVAVEFGGRFAGYALARVLAGEFGRPARAVVVESMGVAPGLWNHGAGHALMRGIDDVMARKGIVEQHTQVEWTNHRLLEFFDHIGFKLAPRQVIARSIHGMPPGTACEAVAAAATTEATRAEIDFSVASPDYQALSRDSIPVRALGENDLGNLVRIDRKTTGRERRDYLERKMHEVLQESGVRLSQIAELDGMPVGFVMAKVDYGEFGQTEPVAVIDTIAVNPDYAGRGVGSAMLSQLFANLHALKVEQVETEVARENFGLLGYLYHRGFAPSQRLALTRQLT